MKVALISQPFDAIVPPSMNSIGIWINQVSRGLAEDHQVVVYGRRGITRRKEIGANVETRYVVSLPERWMGKVSSRLYPLRNTKKPLFSSPLYRLEYILPIALDLRRQQVDIVHLQNFSQFVPVIRALNPSVKIVLHMRCEWLSMLDYRMIEGRIRKTDLTLGVSNYITNLIRERFPQHAQKCSTAYTGVDTDEFKPTADFSDNSRNDGCQKILFVGRITPEKGVHVLLEAFKKIATQFPDLHVDLVGSLDTLPKDHLVGPSEEKQINDLEGFYRGSDYYSHLVSILPPELKHRVHFAGSVRYSAIADLYRQSDILVNPALSEPFGRSLVEANACAVPIIVSRAGGMVELVDHGKNGLLVEPGDVDDLAQAIQRLLRDRTLRRNMGANGRQFVLDRFSWNSIRSNLVSMYQGLLEPDRTG